MSGPLAGLRVGVTRSRTQASRLSRSLEAVGAQPVELPVLEFHPPSSWEPLDAALDGLAGFDGVIFTSVNAVQRTVERARERGLALDWSRPFVAVAGSATEAALASEGISVDLVPPRFLSEALLEALQERFGAALAGMRWLLPRAEVGREVLRAGLTASGSEVVVAPAYRTAPPTDLGPLRAAVPSLDVVTFASGSSVKHLIGAVGPLPADLTVASIGPITSQACRDAGLTVAVEADQARIDALVEAIVRWRTA